MAVARQGTSGTSVAAALPVSGSSPLQLLPEALEQLQELVYSHDEDALEDNLTHPLHSVHQAVLASAWSRPCGCCRRSLCASSDTPRLRHARDERVRC